MTDSQLLPMVLASVPTMITVLIGIPINNARLGDMNGRLGDVNARLGDLRHHMDSRFDEVDRRFDNMKEMWRSELHRVEEVLDARLKHLEER